MAGSICDILPAAASLLGVPTGEHRAGILTHLEPVRRVAVVLVDGMGHGLLPLMAPHAPLIADLLAGGTGHVHRLDCTFPSTTPTSLVSFATGVRPGEHGVLGFTVAVPGTDDVLTHIAWRDTPDPAVWQPVPTWFERLAAAGVSSTAVLPAAFRGSGLTVAAYRGARFAPVGAHDDVADVVLRELAVGPGLVFGYTPVLDTAGHLYGLESPQWRAAAAEVDIMLQRIVAGLPSDAALLVTADHGMLDVYDRIDVAAEPDLAAGIRIVAGEPRVRYLHTEPGATDDVVDAWRGVLGTRAEVLVRDEAVARGWFGPVPDAHRARIGEVVVVCDAPFAVLASGHEPDEVSRLVGFHGGRQAVETAIPLLSVSGS